jgi:hypothetical protein
MTTIAYRSGTLAADQCSWSGGVRRKVRKVFCIADPAQPGAWMLVAFAGSADYAHRVLEWLGGGDKPDPAKSHALDAMSNQCALVIDRPGFGKTWQRTRIRQLSNGLIFSEMQEEFYAFGGGQEFAWGALEAGASARQAVEIAIKRSDYAGFGVDCVAFDDATGVQA